LNFLRRKLDIFFATLLVASWLVIGCASLHGAIPFEEAMAQPPPASAPAKAAAAESSSGDPQRAASPAVTSEALRNALVEFQFGAQDARHAQSDGAAMPKSQARRWTDVLSLVDAYLGESGPLVTADQLNQTRSILEAELDKDAKIFGDFPADLADSIAEHEAELAVRAISLHPPEWKRDARAKFEWPIEPVHVTSLFGRRFHPIDGRFKRHEGLDLAAEPGQLISAAGPGVVRKAGWNGNYGYQVEVMHGGGVMTRYSHLLQPLVEVGDLVDAGDILGLAGSTGYSTGPHLHFEVWRRGKALDPLRMMHFVGGVTPDLSAARKARTRSPVHRATKLLKGGVAEREPIASPP
jgi:murein DD-endopeptidase MepM/ murein hydrolase activator NlpD